MIDSITLRSVRQLDQAFLVGVYGSTREDELAMVPWSDDEKHSFIEMQFTAQSTDYQSRFPDSEHSIIVADGEDAGRIWIDQRADEIRLLDITILPKFRNRGVGQLMLEQLQATASAHKTALRHSVFNTNQDAMRLYERMNFVVIEDFETYVLMEWQPPAT